MGHRIICTQPNRIDLSLVSSVRRGITWYGEPQIGQLTGGTDTSYYILTQSDEVSSTYVITKKNNNIHWATVKWHIRYLTSLHDEVLLMDPLSGETLCLPSLRRCSLSLVPSAVWSSSEVRVAGSWSSDMEPAPGTRSCFCYSSSLCKLWCIQYGLCFADHIKGAVLWDRDGLLTLMHNSDKLFCQRVGNTCLQLTKG